MNFVLAAAVQKKAQAVAMLDLAAAGTNFSLSLQSGRAWGWGLNSSGQIGDNSIVSKITPVSVLGAIKTFCKISAGAAHSLALDKNGRAWAWGSNTAGQLGDNSITQRTTPISILGAVKTFCHIAASLGNHSLALDKNGRAWAWGDGSNGRLGNNSITSQRTPGSVLGAVKTFCKVAVGNAWSAAIDKNGRVWCWGNGGDGRLGRGSTASALTPVSIIGAVKTFCHIGAGNATTAAIDKNGLIWSWGFNNSGQLGNGANTAQCTPVSLAGTRKTFCKISLSNGQTLALDKYGRAWGWGFNANGLLGDNSVTARNTPVSVAGAVKTFCEIAAGSQHGLAIDKSGNTWAWGPNTAGALGAGLPLSIRSPKSIVLGATKTFCHIGTGGGHTAVIDKNGRIWAWGENTNGRIGDNSTTARYTPISILGAVKTFCKIAVGSDFNLAIAANGRVWAWGNNGNGRLGDNSTTSRQTPVSILGAAKTFCHIAAGNAHSAAIDKNGRAWGWGSGLLGALGNSDVTQRLTPVSVTGAVKTFCHISSGLQFSLALTNSGRAWGWGDNYTANLARDPDTEFISVNTPVSIGGTLKTFCRIAAGSYHGLALDLRGRVWGWGANDYGEVGNNDAGFFIITPESALGAVKTFCHISAGLWTSAAIDKNGRIWTWGINDNGQLGDNSITSRKTPVSVAGAAKTFCKIYARSQHMLAIDKNGKVWGWGINTSGQLPIQPENLVVLTPVRVCNI